MRIKYGATRIVLIFNKFVIKIPNFRKYDLFLNGILGNLQESIWSGFHPDLARVIHYSRSGLFLIMERAIVVSDEVDPVDFFDLIDQKYEDDGLKEFLLSDCKPDNWGYVNGKLVKVDYGS